MSSYGDKSYLTNLSKDENKDAIPNRIQFVKALLKDNKLRPLIDFDNTDTENFMNQSKDDDSKNSNDTRIALKKKVYDLTDIINDIGGTLRYIKSGTTGHTFKGKCTDSEGNLEYEYAVKVVAYSKKTKYGDVRDLKRPENAELAMIKLLSYFIVKRCTPHIILPIGIFDTDITYFTKLVENGFVKKKNERYKEFIERYKNGEYYDEVSILISEWANRGDFLDYIKKHYVRFTPLHWRVFFFQLISTLAVIHYKFPTFRHNDLKANNVLVTKISKKVETYKYKVVGNLYRVPNIGYQLKIWDFDFACIPGTVDNKKVMLTNKWSKGINVNGNKNRYYDIHYFFNTLIKKGFFPEIMTSPLVPQEVKNFILSIVPIEYQSGDNVAEKGRILVDNEYTTPEEILKTNKYFDEFRDVEIRKPNKRQDLHLEKFLNGGGGYNDINRNKSKSRSKTRSKSGSKSKTESKQKNKKNIKQKRSFNQNKKQKENIKQKSKPRKYNEKLNKKDKYNIDALMMGN
jgi:hypothetical protein